MLEFLRLNLIWDLYILLSKRIAHFLSPSLATGVIVAVGVGEEGVIGFCLSLCLPPSPLCLALTRSICPMQFCCQVPCDILSALPLLVGEAIPENAKAPVLLWVLDFASLRIQDVAEIVIHVIFAYLPGPKDHMKYFTYVIQFSPHPSLWGRCPHIPTYKRGAWESRGFATCLISQKLEAEPGFELRPICVHSGALP